MGAWGQHHGNGTMGVVPSERQQFFLLSVSKKILHCMIEMIYFDGSIGKGGEGRHFFFIYVSKNILHLMIQMIYFDRSEGKRGCERERGKGSVGKGAWELHCGYIL